MLKNILQAVFLAIILTSCQREVSIIQRMNNDPLLEKIITVTSPQNDSSIITYEYDNSDRLIKETYYNRYPTTNALLPSWQEYTRDSNGRIVHIRGVGRSFMNPAVEIASSATVFYVNDTSTRVVSIINDGNGNKTSFIYNNSGQIIKTEDHQRLQPTDPLRLVVYHLYQYDAVGNITEMKEFTDQDNNGSFEFNIGAHMQYDGKVNPMFKRDGALFETWPANVSPGNCIKMFVDNPHPLSIQDTVLQQFTYRPDARPQTVLVSGNSIQQSFRTYFYR